MNRDNLGGYAPGGTYNTNALEDISFATKGLWSTPAYWNGNVYLWASDDVPKQFEINSGVMGTTASSLSSVPSAFPGASFSISSDGTQNGVAWAVRTDQYVTHGAGVLYAWDANNLASLLYESDTNAARDSLGPANKFSVPVVTNGKVYVASVGQVDVYGLLNGLTSAAAPSITPDGGTFGGAQTVTLSSTTSPANIYYTLNGTVPTPAATLYTDPITVDTDTTIRAIASAEGFLQSPVSSASFTFTGQTPAVSFSPGGGTFTAAQKVSLSDTDTSAKIYYTTNGQVPSSSSNLYTGPISVTQSTTINAIAIDSHLQNSVVTTASYISRS